MFDCSVLQVCIEKRTNDSLKITEQPVSPDKPNLNGIRMYKENKDNCVKIIIYVERHRHLNKG